MVGDAGIPKAGDPRERTEGREGEGRPRQDLQFSPPAAPSPAHLP